MQKPDPLVIELNTKMFANLIKAGDACRKAGVNPSTWSRWAAGGVPDLPTLRRLDAAVDEMVAGVAGAS